MLHHVAIHTFAYEPSMGLALPSTQLIQLISAGQRFPATPNYPAYPLFVVAMDAEMGSSAQVRLCRMTGPGQCL